MTRDCKVDDRDTFSLDDIDNLVAAAATLPSPVKPYRGHYLFDSTGTPVSGDRITGVVATLPEDDGPLVIALLVDGGTALLLGIDAFAEISGVTEEEVRRQIEEGEIPTCESKVLDTHPPQGVG